MTSFIGRASELSRLSEYFDGEVRVVTISGPAGAGKSRLAARYAAESSDAGRWPLGVSRVDLLDVVDRDGALAAIANALGLDALVDTPRSLEGLADTLAHEAGTRLVIIEHGEHLLTALRPIVTTLAEHAHVLITSREQLGLRHEWCVALSPLGSSQQDETPGEAVQLLLERCAALGFDPCRACGVAPVRCEQLSALAETLDGNPLALELAARRLGLMNPCQLYARMTEQVERRFELLAAAPHDPKTLWAAIARSVVLLSEAEHSAFSQLSVFADAFALDAAEQVLLLPEGAPGGLDLLDSLARKSLIEVLSKPSTGRNPILRLANNERTFARKLLVRDAVQLAQAAERHARWLVGRAAGGSIHELVPDLCQAITWALHPELIDDVSLTRAFEMLGALQPALRSRGMLERVLPLFESALTHAERVAPALSTATRAVLAEALYLHGRGAEASTLLERTLTNHRGSPADDPLREALLLCSLGASHFYGRNDVRIDELESACRTLEEAGLVEAALDTRMRLARAHENVGHIEEAMTLYEQVLEDARGAHQRRRVALVRLNLGALQAHLGMNPASHYRAALAWSRELADPRLEAVTLLNLGIAAFEARRDDDAIKLFLEAIEAETPLGVGRVTAVAQGHLAILAHLAGELPSARLAYAAALLALRDAWPDPLMWSLLVMGSAVLSARMGDLVTAQHEIGRLMLAHERESGPEPASAILLRLAELGVAPTDTGSLVSVAEQARQLTRPVLAALTRRPRAGAYMVRVALRLLGGDLSESAPPVFTVARGGQRFVTSDGRAVDLGRRGAARRILAELAARRVSGPGRGAGVQELFELAWPGERISQPYRANRVYVAIADLRKLGLEGVLLNNGDGYLLDPAVPMVLVDR